MHNEVLHKVRKLLPGIDERASVAEEQRIIPERTMAELADAGAFRMLQPKRYGGLETDPVHFYAVVREISAVCGSTGWVVSVLGVHPWHVSLFPEEAQDEVWASGPDTLISSSYAPVGRLTAVEGGYELSGRWKFSSGCDYASWALLGGLVMGHDGKPVDFLSVLVPRKDYEVIDVWDTVGLRGTGSNDIQVEKVFVPEHRIVRNYEVARLRGPGRKLNEGPLYGLPFGALFTTAVSVPVVGAVAGCYESYIATMRDRIRLSFGGTRFAEDQNAQIAIARAASEIDASVLQLDRNITALYDYAVQHEEIPMELRLRTRRDQVRATERALDAIDILFKTAGGNSLSRGNPIERAWRDAHAGSVHVANDAERALAMYGKGTFGLTVEDNLL